MKKQAAEFRRDAFAACHAQHGKLPRPSGQFCLDPNNSVCGVPTQPTIEFVDPASGAVWAQSGGTFETTGNVGVTVNGQGFAPGPVTLSTDSPSGAQIASGFADSNGNFSIPFVIVGSTMQLVAWQQDATGAILQTTISVFLNIPR